MNLSHLRRALIGRKSRAGLVNMAFAVLVGWLVTHGHIDREIAIWIIGGGSLGTAMNIWGIAHEDAARKKNGGVTL